jgi:hypothetical protein
MVSQEKREVQKHDHRPEFPAPSREVREITCTPYCGGQTERAKGTKGSEGKGRGGEGREGEGRGKIHQRLGSWGDQFIYNQVRVRERMVTKQSISCSLVGEWRGILVGNVKRKRTGTSVAREVEVMIPV